MKWMGIFVALVMLMLGAIAYQYTAQPMSVSLSDGSAPENLQPFPPPFNGKHQPHLSTDLPFADSIRDIQPDFRLQQNDHGSLVITLDVLDLFELYLSTLGELTEEQVNALIRNYSEQQLSEAAAEELMDLFRRYRDYLKAAADMPVFVWNPMNSNAMDWQSVRQQAADIEALQRHYLPDAYDVFFAHDSQETLRLLNELQHGEMTLMVLSEKEYENNPDRTNRIAERQQQREQWQQRLNDFSAWQQALALSGLADTEYQQLLQQELQQRFSENEQYRVKSLLALW